MSPRRGREVRPTHVVANPGDRKALCGLKNPLPVVWAVAVKAHVDGHGMAVCPGCARAMAAKR